MNSNSFLILFVFFTSSEAFEDTWTLTSADGLTSCNYSFSYNKENDVTGDEEVISDFYECGDSTETCTGTLSYNKTFITQYSVEDDLDPRYFDDVVGRVGKMAKKAGIAYRDSRSKNGNFSCTVNQGYRAKIATKPQFHRLNGSLEESCLTSCSECIVSTRSTALKIDIPAKSNTDDQIAGSLSCKVEPAANIKGLKVLCNKDKLQPGKIVQAVAAALQKAAINTALNGVKTIEHTNIDGNEAWSLGMCWNGINRGACRACLNYLVDNIMRRCDNSVGAQLYGTNCGIRYEIHKIITYNYEDSFPR